MNHLLTITLTIGLIASISSTAVNQCGESIPFPLSTDILNCEIPPCKFIRNQYITADLTFYSPRYIDKLTAQVLATALGTEVNYGLDDQTDACEHLVNTRCPLEKDEYVHYRLEMFVQEIFPKVSLSLKLSLLDQLNNTVTCMAVDGVVT
nr:Niemann-Pick C2 protein [Lasioderma serricorne]